MSGDDKTVRCKCAGRTTKGTFEVDDGILTLTSPFGVTKANIGFQNPKRAAGRMLKNICAEAARTADESNADSPPSDEADRSRS